MVANLPEVVLRIIVRFVDTPVLGFTCKGLYRITGKQIIQAGNENVLPIGIISRVDDSTQTVKLYIRSDPSLLQKEDPTPAVIPSLNTLEFTVGSTVSSYTDVFDHIVTYLRNTWVVPNATSLRCLTLRLTGLHGGSSEEQRTALFEVLTEVTTLESLSLGQDSFATADTTEPPFVSRSTTITVSDLTSLVGKLGHLQQLQIDWISVSADELEAGTLVDLAGHFTEAMKQLQLGYVFPKGNNTTDVQLQSFIERVGEVCPSITLFSILPGNYSAKVLESLHKLQSLRTMSISYNANNNTNTPLSCLSSASVTTIVLQDDACFTRVSPDLHNCPNVSTLVLKQPLAELFQQDKAGIGGIPHHQPMPHLRRLTLQCAQLETAVVVAAFAAQNLQFLHMSGGGGLIDFKVLADSYPQLQELEIIRSECSRSSLARPVMSSPSSPTSSTPPTEALLPQLRRVRLQLLKSSHKPQDLNYGTVRSGICELLKRSEGLHYLHISVPDDVQQLSDKGDATDLLSAIQSLGDLRSLQLEWPNLYRYPGNEERLTALCLQLQNSHVGIDMNVSGISQEELASQQNSRLANISLLSLGDSPQQQEPNPDAVKPCCCLVM